MRVLIGAAAALLFAASAAAQTGSTTPATPTPPAPPSACGELQPSPTFPDPAHATSAQMTHANQAYEPWATDTRAKLQCRQGELRALAAQVAAAEAAYNAQAAAFTSTVNSWQSATAAYNAQHGAGSHASQRGSALGQHGPN